MPRFLVPPWLNDSGGMESTLAPKRSAIETVLSVEPESTTTISDSMLCLRTASRVAAKRGPALFVGMTMLTEGLDLRGALAMGIRRQEVRTGGDVGTALKLHERAPWESLGLKRE